MHHNRLIFQEVISEWVLEFDDYDMAGVKDGFSLPILSKFIVLQNSYRSEVGAFNGYCHQESG